MKTPIYVFPREIPTMKRYHKLLLYFIKMETAVDIASYPPSYTKFKKLKGKTYIYEIGTLRDDHPNCRCIVALIGEENGIETIQSV